jgi:hypothetical protein
VKDTVEPSTTADVQDYEVLVKDHIKDYAVDKLRMKG